MTKAWTFLGEGTFNKAYKSDDGKLVFKRSKFDSDKTDTPERSVRLWNLINPNLPPPASVHMSDQGLGWVCPFVEGKQASDLEMSEAVIDIFSRTGRIVIDATARKNFIKTKEPQPHGQVVCIDIGMALQLELQQETGYVKRARSNSIVSQDTWNDSKTGYDTEFFPDTSKGSPVTVNTVKALLFIKANRPDIIDVNFLKARFDLINLLAAAYDKQNPQVAQEKLEKEINDQRAFKQLMKETIFEVRISQQEADAQNTNHLVNSEQSLDEGNEIPTVIQLAKAGLSQEQTLDFDVCKLAIIKTLERYIDSRGKISTSGVFQPSWTSKWFRDLELTREKVRVVQIMIETIKDPAINSPDLLEDVLTGTHGSCVDLDQGFVTRSYEAAIGECLEIKDLVSDLDLTLQHDAPKA